MGSADPPFIDSILLPTDFAADTEHAFAHALAIALVRQTEFTILHAATDFLGEDEWTKFPAVRGTLERWGLLEAGSPRSAVFEKFAVRVEKVNVKGNPLSACMKFLEQHPTDLLVLATHRREGLPNWIRHSEAEQIARRARTLCLFVPEGVRGFVAPQDGEISLRRILVPVDRRPDPQPALDYAARSLALAAGEPVEAVAFHVGEEMPELSFPGRPGLHWSTRLRPGSGSDRVVDEIVEAANAESADLIVMATDGPDSLLDVLRGSHTDRVLRRAPCPLLAVPEP